MMGLSRSIIAVGMVLVLGLSSVKAELNPKPNEGLTRNESIFECEAFSLVATTAQRLLSRYKWQALGALALGYACWHGSAETAVLVPGWFLRRGPMMNRLNQEFPEGAADKSNNDLGNYLSSIAKKIPGFQITSPTMDDYPAIEALLKEGFPNEFVAGGPLQRDYKIWFQDMLEGRRPGFFFIAKSDERIIGAVGAQPENPESTMWVLMSLVIAKDMRRKGVARALTKAWLERSYRDDRITRRIAFANLGAHSRAIFKELGAYEELVDLSYVYTFPDQHGRWPDDIQRKAWSHHLMPILSLPEVADWIRSGAPVETEDSVKKAISYSVGAANALDEFIGLLRLPEVEAARQLLGADLKLVDLVLSLKPSSFRAVVNISRVAHVLERLVDPIKKLTGLIFIAWLMSHAMQETRDSTLQVAA